MKESQMLAPQAYAHAELLRQQAEQAHQDGDLPSSQILGEHAIAAYNHAFVLTRLVKADQRRARAQGELERARSELQKLDEQQKRLAAEAEDLETRYKVARDALPLSPSSPASAEREKARIEQARALSSQARLLCIAARMIDARAEQPSKDIQALDALEKDFSKQPAGVIDRARQLRASCLKSVTLARRPAMARAPQSGVADTLLQELSNAGKLFPFRDDRGVVVTLRGVFTAGSAPGPDAAQTLSFLGRIAKAHPSFPVLVVLHTSKNESEAPQRARGEAIARALREAGAPRVDVAAAGSSQPVADPKQSGATQRNERVEVVFVAPAP
jgi:hypothetical protein